jgi:hypothetical protein
MILSNIFLRKRLTETCKKWFANICYVFCITMINKICIKCLAIDFRTTIIVLVHLIKLFFYLEIWAYICRTYTFLRTIPSHLLLPLSLKPVLHTHEYEPALLLHVEFAFRSQRLPLLKHSSTSISQLSPVHPFVNIRAMNAFEFNVNKQMKI